MLKKLLGAGSALLAVSLSYGSGTPGDLSFNGVWRGGNVTVNAPMTSYGFAGTLSWHMVSGASNVNPYYTVCGDLTDDFISGNPSSPWHMDLFDSSLYAGSLLGGSDLTKWTAAGYVADNSVQVAGSIVGGVGANNGGTLGTLDANHAQGLQIAVWFALYGSTSASTLDFDGVPYSGIKLSGYTSGALTAAQSYWTSYKNAGYSAVFFRGNGLHNGQGFQQQDQFGLNDGGGGHYLVTPEPVTSALGFAAVGLFIRRRTRAKKA